MQTLEKGGANFRFLTQGVRILKNGGINSVSVEKLHGFEIICPARSVRSPHPLCVCAWKLRYANYLDLLHYDSM